jgi:hypothetical protein
MIVSVRDGCDPRKIEELRRLIDDEEYLDDAIKRIAQVLSDALIGTRSLGAHHERDRKTAQR